MIAICHAASAQKLPGSIRGYKVHQVKANVISNGAGSKDASSDISIELMTPSLVDVTLSGAVLEVDAEFTAAHSGKVDLITFHDFKANGIPFEIDDVSTPFKFKKNKTVSMPGPARVTVSLTSIPRAIYKQISQDPADINVTGRAFVFGRFKRFGMTFKRVIPITVDITIKNPLHSPDTPPTPGEPPKPDVTPT